MDSVIPNLVPNWVAGLQCEAESKEQFSKFRPADGTTLCEVARSRETDIKKAVLAAASAQRAWANMPPVARGEILYNICDKLREHREDMAAVVAEETGKSGKEALGETGGAIALGRFYAGEGQRLFGRTLVSGVANRYPSTIRVPVGIAGLIAAANTPIANVAWKVFPALICGNAAILKASEDTPATAWYFGELAKEAGLPDGVLNIVQGYGIEAGPPLVEHPDVGVISFTGSTAVGKQIAVQAGERMAKVSLELGGKNPLVVCDDADLDSAVHWTLLSAFSNAGQRCAAASRIIVFDKVYDQFRDALVRRTNVLRVGPTGEDDLGPVINQRQLDRMLSAVSSAVDSGATVLAGGNRLVDAERAAGYYMAPTLLENVAPDDPISTTEIFGPIACMYRVNDYVEALQLANRSPYGLTACIHTKNLDRALAFTRDVRAGVAVVNAGTYGSEPHMPFGGVGFSGNGSREPGTEALDVYTDLRNVILNADLSRL
jgi:aldehyde dehydrogenase (NAD+)